MKPLARDSEQKIVTILSGAAISEAVYFAPFVSGVLHMPAAWTAANIGFQVSSTPDGTFLPLYEEDGATLVLITGPAVDNAYVLPDKLAGALHFQLWSNTAAVDTNQGADRVITLELKT